jgi:2'-5' RNA ligase
MPRQFTALELPDGVVSQLALMRGGGGARWLEPEDYHVTLRFIGDIDTRAARDIAETLGDIRWPKTQGFWCNLLTALSWRPSGGFEGGAMARLTRAGQRKASEIVRRFQRSVLPSRGERFDV